jgi:hypothetical protein
MLEVPRSVNVKTVLGRGVSPAWKISFYQRLESRFHFGNLNAISNILCEIGGFMVESLVCWNPISGSVFKANR